MYRPSLRKWIIIGPPLAIFAATTGFMAFDRHPVLTYTKHSLEPARVRPGEYLTVTFAVLWTRECPGVVNRTFTLMDGSTYTWDPIVAALSDDIKETEKTSKYTYPKEGTLRRTFIIPADTPKFKIPRGRATYQTRIDYYCNVLQRAFSWPVVVYTPVMPLEIID